MKKTKKQYMAKNAGIDIIGAGYSGGSVASKLLDTNMDVSQLRTNAVLRKDEWELYDKAVVQTTRERLNIIKAFMGRGLKFTIPNGLAHTVLTHEAMSDMNPASVSMDGLNRGDNDRVEFDLRYLPLPILHKDFRINARNLAASRKGGTPLDTTQAEVSARKVAELAESIFMNGYNAYAYGGGIIYGLTDYPNRQALTISDWLGSTPDPVADVRAAKQKLINKGFYGPYLVIVATNMETVLDDDYVSGYPKTVRQRIGEIAGIAGIEVSDQLAADAMIVVQLSSDVCRVVEGMGVTNLQWDEEGGMLTNFKVMSIMVPQIREDYNNNCGIVHGAKA
jgi:uncharacterized linocin/CFP29 family protein